LEVLGGVVGAEQLLTHHGEDEDDNGQDEAEVAERAHRPADDADQQVQSRPRLGQLEHAQLKRTVKPTALPASRISHTATGLLIPRLHDTRQPVVSCKRGLRIRTTPGGVTLFQHVTSHLGRLSLLPFVGR